jgi:hypothetical protein
MTSRRRPDGHTIAARLLPCILIGVAATLALAHDNQRPSRGSLS